MIPVHEQGDGCVFGHRINRFIRRFDEICAEFTEKERTGAFALFFYDSQNVGLRKILDDQDVFAQLELLADADLRLFYVHASKPKSIQRFNSDFLTSLGVEATAQLPCVVLFRCDGEAIHDIAIAQLDNANVVQGFTELPAAIADYKAKELDSSPTPAQHLKWIRATGESDTLEMVRGGLRRTLDQL
ncbi:hypothetical protein Pla108_33640 [Botrimarina colliarenosi]|uniref:Uncharacterized protein n=1 Tax=Botrimarina colliarenosi TaxID=2528001 RepID=A0A5C6A870_9BACT|nr:hypothetical protein [Botrimarina colliarenosi]TWT95221.1 hypothetical protein Pla108_33640 [Botrimarina colliarenosi]